MSDTLKGITDGDSRSDYVDKVNDDSEVGEYIQACAAKINSQVKAFGRNWAGQSDRDKLIAASSCPKALQAELGEQIQKAKYVERALKAKVKTQKITPAEKEIDNNSNINPAKEAKPPSMWESGTGNSKKPSSLCIPAACVLVGILYGARMARYDLIRPVQSLATYLHEWDADCDARLNRLVSYVQSTLH